MTGRRDDHRVGCRRAADGVCRGSVCQAGINTEGVLDAGEKLGAHTLREPAYISVDRPLHHRIEHVFVALGDTTHRFEGSIGDMARPPVDLVFTQICHGQELAVIAHRPDDRIWLL